MDCRVKPGNDAGVGGEPRNAPLRLPKGRGGKRHSFAMHQPPRANGERRIE